MVQARYDLDLLQEACGTQRTGDLRVQDLDRDLAALERPSRPLPCEQSERGGPIEPPLSVAADCVQYSHRSVTGVGASFGGMSATLVLSPFPPRNEGLFRAAIMMGWPV